MTSPTSRNSPVKSHRKMRLRTTRGITTLTTVSENITRRGGRCIVPRRTSSWLSLHHGWLLIFHLVTTFLLILAICSFHHHCDRRSILAWLPVYHSPGAWDGRKTTCLLRSMGVCTGALFPPIWPGTLSVSLVPYDDIATTRECLPGNKLFHHENRVQSK